MHRGIVHVFLFSRLQGSVQCLQFDDFKIVSGSWDTSCIVSDGASGVFDGQWRWLVWEVVGRRGGVC